MQEICHHLNYNIFFCFEIFNCFHNLSIFAKFCIMMMEPHDMEALQQEELEYVAEVPVGPQQLVERYEEGEVEIIIQSAAEAQAEVIAEAQRVQSLQLDEQHASAMESNGQIVDEQVEEQLTRRDYATQSLDTNASNNVGSENPNIRLTVVSPIQRSLIPVSNLDEPAGILVSPENDTPSNFAVHANSSNSVALVRCQAISNLHSIHLAQTEPTQAVVTRSRRSQHVAPRALARMPSRSLDEQRVPRRTRLNRIRRRKLDTTQSSIEAMNKILKNTVHTLKRIKSVLLTQLQLATTSTSQMIAQQQTLPDYPPHHLHRH